ncbi:MAG: IS66 family transposase [Shewanella sp.]|nr:IS66 family transposase [Shewanella sp.]
MKTTDNTTSYSEHEVQKLRAENGLLNDQVKQLKHQLDWFKRQVFGEKSEKRDMTDNPFQQTIADVLKELPEAKAPENEEKQTVTYERGKAKKNNLDGSPDDSGLRFDSNVPVEEIALSRPELEGPDADDYTIIGHKTTYRLAQRPGSQVVLKYTRPVIKKKSTQKISTTEAPANVLDKSFADVSFLVGMLLDKFLYHLPLYRQHQRLALNGITVARSTLTNLSQRSIELLRPIYQAQLQNILLSRVLAMDETPIKAGRGKKGKMKRAYFWPIYGDQDEVCFTFSQSRGMQHILDQLGDFEGTLVTDGYGAYEKFQKKSENLTHAQCWVHARRYFDQSQQAEPESAAIALAYIGRLYAHEETIGKQQLQGEQKAAYRCKNTKPVVDAFFAWCYEQRQRIDLVKSNPLSKALAYVMRRQLELSVFLSDPDVPMDTNHLERALRVIPMGRKNWLFSWSEIGAEHVGIIQSLLVSCRLHDVNPYEYLVDVLQRINCHPASKVEELTPRLWKEKFADNPLRSDLEA